MLHSDIVSSSCTFPPLHTVCQRRQRRIPLNKALTKHQLCAMILLSSRELQLSEIGQLRENDQQSDGNGRRWMQGWKRRNEREVEHVLRRLVRRSRRESTQAGVCVYHHAKRGAAMSNLSPTTEVEL